MYGWTNGQKIGEHIKMDRLTKEGWRRGNDSAVTQVDLTYNLFGCAI